MVKLINAVYLEETEKAYKIEVDTEGMASVDHCWFPKSHSFFEDGDTSKDFYAEQWLIDAKSEELGDYILTEKK